MNLQSIKDDMQKVLEIGVDDKVKKLFSPLSDDDGVRCLSLIRRVVSKFELYCKFFEAKTFEHPEGSPVRSGRDTGRLVRVRPCDEKYENKTFTGIYIGDAALSSSVSIKEGSIICSWAHMNPAILVPEINEVIYGAGSWWSFVGEDDEKEITDEVIENTWYVKLFKGVEKNEANKEKRDHPF